MAGIELSITLDKPDKTYKGGETIAGHVMVAAAEDVRTAALMVVLYCKGYSEKKTRIAGPDIATMEREIEETNLFKGPWTPGEHTYPFSFTAPPGPRTYKGHVFDVTWHIGAKVRTSRGKDKDVKAEENIILLPGGERASRDHGGEGAKEVVHRQSARNLIGCFGFSLALFLVGSIVAWIYLPFAEEAGDVEGVFFFGGVIPTLLGLLLIIGVTYQALINKRIKKVEVKLGSGQVRPGETIPCSVTFEANIPFRIERISAVLTGEEVVDFRSPSRKPGQLRKYALHESRQELPLAVKQVPVKVPYYVQGEVMIPEGIPYSIDLMVEGEGMALTWGIEFIIEMKWWPDWRHYETIDVQP
jgi:hypothetical protein